MKKTVIGIVAHVDAGKTTLAEALLYTTGKLRKAGRVDHGDTLLDSHMLEKERGITIFSSQAVIVTKNIEITLLDTPGHVDFSAEAERTMQILDYAILVISGIEGVQSHTKTLWRLLKAYNIPTFIFVTKMDFARHTHSEITEQLKKMLDSDCVDFSDDTDVIHENLAMCREDLLEKYLINGKLDDSDISALISGRLAFPCYFGSGLKFEGIAEFIDGLEKYVVNKKYSDSFGAKVFKISHDAQGNRLTHFKITGGKIKVRDSVNDEKIAQIRIYNGAKYTTVDEVGSGDVCAVLGLNKTYNGQSLGIEATLSEPILEPVMNYRIVLPDGCDAKTFMPKLKQLEEEDPLLKITWNSHFKEIHVSLMGEVQIEILKSIISERFCVDVEIDSGRVLYKETISDTVEGVGHYEPLRHYAEVHLLLEPLPNGSGIEIKTRCNDDMLDRNWQRLILAHISEKQHLGVLTGSPITDMRITLVAGRAHLKHTEGGDFRQATYRAIRQGLMKAKSKLLEPYYKFRLEVPSEQIGRAISDIRMKSGEFDSPENLGEMSVLIGKAPVTTLNGYASEVASYTSGQGRLSFELAGYFECHNEEKVISEFNYQPEADLENTPDSVFCAHGSGFVVKWDKVSEYMHIESCIKKEPEYTPQLNRRNFHIDDKELEAIMEREFGKVKNELYRPKPQKVDEAKNFELVNRKQYVIVDGYNVIFAWNDLKKLSESSLEDARVRLMDILCNYAEFTKSNVILVFDAYKVQGNTGEKFDYNNIHVVYTKERELGDVYIEKLISDIGKNDKVRVVTSDGLIQLSAVRFGVLRVSALEFEKEIDSVNARISRVIGDIKDKTPKSKLSDKASL